MAKKPQKSVVVAQFANPKHNPEIPPHPHTNGVYAYEVVKTTNTIEVSIGQRLTPKEVAGLIALFIRVEVTKPK